MSKEIRKGIIAILFIACFAISSQSEVFAGGSQDSRKRSVFSSIEEIENGIKNAVDALAMDLQVPADTRIGPFTFADTDAPAGISRYLTDIITYFAASNDKYNVLTVNYQIDTNAATLTGHFTKSHNRLDFTLELITPDETNDASQVVSIDINELERLGLSIEPENLDKITELEQIIESLADANTENTNNPPVSTAQANQGINIQAFFNSDSMTYFHRDQLKMTLTADRNCYFKVIHIDANNQMKMIYPNSSDTNNRLSANVPRAIFETANYMLYDPYGAEVILVVASSQQFPNIDREYVTPWVAATGSNIRSAVRGQTRGGDLESPITFSGEGEARYTINILRPHEEYSYVVPENIREAYQAISAEVQQKGGTLEGNETSGFYIIDNVRTSYRIPRDAPDTIQFAIYYLDNFTRGKSSRVTTRGAGSGFNFNIPRPGNITQTIHQVKSGIEGSGGRFSGNEQQGNFQAKGITGQYRVADDVNVTITDKPFVIPNSMIEREVRSYFSER
jgi:hypothetical protein